MASNRGINKYNQEDSPCSGSLVNYLSEPAVAAKLQENIALLKSTLINDPSNKNRGLISRYFNNLPGKHLRIQPLLSILPEAIKTNQIKAWVDFTIAYGFNDLFDAQGNLLPSIYALLNHDGTLAALIAKFGKDLVNVQLHASYVCEIIGGHAAVVLSSMPVVMNDQSLFLTYFNSFNNSVKNITAIDPTTIDTIKDNLLAVSHNKELSGSQLQGQINLFLCENEIYASMHDADPDLATQAAVILHEIERVKLMPAYHKQLPKLHDIMRWLNRTLEAPIKTDVDAGNTLVKELNAGSWGTFAGAVSLGVAGITSSASAFIPANTQDLEKRVGKLLFGIGATAAAGYLLFKPVPKSTLVREMEEFVKITQAIVSSKKVSHVPNKHRTSRIS